MELNLNGNRLHLMAAHAVHDAERETLFVADLHLGKIAAFHQAGVALPVGSDEETLQRLAQVLATTAAKTLVILGDVFHARVAGMEPVIESITAWRRKHDAVRWVIVPGNHDRRVPWQEWLPDAELLKEGDTIGPWRVAHHPDQDAMTPTLCGHLHPGVAIGSGRIRRKVLPCFWLRGSSLVLPAFGAFTGLHRIDRESGDRVFVPVEDRVVEIPSTSRK